MYCHFKFKFVWNTIITPPSSTLTQHVPRRTRRKSRHLEFVRMLKYVFWAAAGLTVETLDRLVAESLLYPLMRCPWATHYTGAALWPMVDDCGCTGQFQVGCRSNDIWTNTMYKGKPVPNKPCKESANPLIRSSQSSVSCSWTLELGIEPSPSGHSKVLSVGLPVCLSVCLSMECLFFYHDLLTYCLTGTQRTGRRAGDVFSYLQYIVNSTSNTVL